MKKLLIIFIILITSGCMGPLVPVIDMNRNSIEQINKEVFVYTISDLSNKSYERLGEIKAVSCMNKIWDPIATPEDATNQLKYKASMLGGNGITNLLCENKEGTNLVKNCWNSVTCRAIAIKVNKKGVVKWK